MSLRRDPAFGYCLRHTNDVGMWIDGDIPVSWNLLPTLAPEPYEH